jgi:hypothetical protein
VGILALLALATPTVQAQTAFGGSFADFDGDSNYGATDELRDTENDAANDALDSGVEMSQWGLDTYESANEFLENYQALGNTDNLCDIGNSGPRIPSSCGEEGSECHECFRSATEICTVPGALLTPIWRWRRAPSGLAIVPQGCTALRG